eukprot:TRINITY_DN597_c0_g1_i4.p1 TRINITY_DN597_c0_g1~~TRINITY_DN597_c0_g1_i4.p1  ORF type:complete len:157 (-),score=53.28 TRINITY_DN597_c0_g1_i4:302-772(-)
MGFGGYGGKGYGGYGGGYGGFGGYGMPMGGYPGYGMGMGMDPMTMMMMMGGGKGWGGKGKGKGKGRRNGLKADPTLKVWIGNVPDSVNWKALQDHLNTAGKTKWVEAFKSAKNKGTGAAVYATAEEASNAVTALNGSDLGGQSIVVDSWVKAVKEA